MEFFSRFARAVERRLGNTGLGALAGFVFFAAVTGAAVQSHSTSKSAESVLSGTTTSTTSGLPTSSTSSTVATLATTTTVASVTTTTGASRTGVNGYSAVAFTVTPTSNPAKKFCGLLAASADQQAQGLMGKNDLGGYDAMIFPFQADTTAAFYMANVPMPLSVAWFDKDGKFVSSTDMPVCTVAAAKCPLFKAAGAYRTAIETQKGGLGGLGVGSGSVISVGAAAPC